MEMGDKKAGLDKLQLRVVFHFLVHSTETELQHFYISVRQALFGSLWLTLLLSLTHSGYLCQCHSRSFRLTLAQKGYISFWPFAHYGLSVAGGLGSTWNAPRIVKGGS